MTTKLLMNVTSYNQKHEKKRHKKLIIANKMNDSLVSYCEGKTGVGFVGRRILSIPPFV